MLCKFCGKYIETSRAYCAKCGKRYSKAVSKLNTDHLAAARAQFIAPFEQPEEKTVAKAPAKKRFSAMFKKSK